MSRILIVEDDADISNMLSELLSPHYSISQAFSGTEAVMCAEREEFDLILLDLMLPGMTGEEVLERVRSQGNVPVIAVSAKDDKSTKVGLLKSGVDDFIGKPFDNDELMARIEALLRRSSGGGSSDVLTFKNVKLNRSTMDVGFRDKPVSLTRREYRSL